MKAFNLIALSYGFAFASVFGLCFLGEQIFGDEAKFIIIVPALLIGMNSRRIMEKILGYTLLEAYKGENDESK